MILIIENPTDKYKDDKIYADIVNYCTNPKKCKSGYIVLPNMDKDNMAQEMYDLSAKYHKLRGTRIRHEIISLEESDHANPADALLLAQHACDDYKDDYQVFVAVHEDTDHLHIHMVMNTVNIHDGKKYTRGLASAFREDEAHEKRSAETRYEFPHRPIIHSCTIPKDGVPFDKRMKKLPFIHFVHQVTLQIFPAKAPAPLTQPERGKLLAADKMIERVFGYG